MSTDWPREIGGNTFMIAKLDPQVPPSSMKVTTWSNVFGDGGNVTIEAYDATGKRHSGNYGSIPIESNRQVHAERDYLQDLLDDFLTDLPRNWALMVETARAYVAAYYAKSAAEYAEKSEKAARGVFK